MRLLACLIVAPQRGYDEPAILSYAISSFCPTSADGLQTPRDVPVPMIKHDWAVVALKDTLDLRASRGRTLVSDGAATARPRSARRNAPHTDPNWSRACCNSVRRDG